MSKLDEEWNKAEKFLEENKIEEAIFSLLKSIEIGYRKSDCLWIMADHYERIGDLDKHYYYSRKFIDSCKDSCCENFRIKFCIESLARRPYVSFADDLEILKLELAELKKYKTTPSSIAEIFMNKQIKMYERFIAILQKAEVK